MRDDKVIDIDKVIDSMFKDVGERLSLMCAPVFIDPFIHQKIVSEYAYSNIIKEHDTMDTIFQKCLFFTKMFPHALTTTKTVSAHVFSMCSSSVNRFSLYCFHDKFLSSFWNNYERLKTLCFFGADCFEVLDSLLREFVFDSEICTTEFAASFVDSIDFDCVFEFILNCGENTNQFCGII